MWLQDCINLLCEANPIHSSYLLKNSALSLNSTSGENLAGKVKDGEAQVLTSSSDHSNPSFVLGYGCLYQEPLKVIELHRLKQLLQK
jgi:hypothetical protein